MKIFVTGATGTLGRPTVKRLVAAGHEVSAMSRSDENATLIRSLGAKPVPSHLLDEGAVDDAVVGQDAVLHLATRIPPRGRMSEPGVWEENDRIRTDGTRNLVNAARDAGVSTIIYPSITFFYPDSGDRWIDESVPPHDPAPQLLSTLDAERDVARFTKTGGRGIVLRMGIFYGPGVASTLDALEMARKGTGLPGSRKSYWSQIWVEDAADAVVAALKAPAGTYNVVEDDPSPRGELIRIVAEAVGRKDLFAPPSLLIRIVAGRGALWITRSHRVSNKAFKQATGWKPSVPNSRDGWRMIQATLKGQTLNPETS